MAAAAPSRAIRRGNGGAGCWVPPRAPSEPAGARQAYPIFSDSEEELPLSGLYDRDEESPGREVDPARTPKVQNLIDFEACSKVAAAAEVRTALLQHRLSVQADSARLERAFEESRARDRRRVACMVAGLRDRQLQRDALLVWFLASRRATPPRAAATEAAAPRLAAPEAARLILARPSQAEGGGLLAVGVPVAWSGVLALWSHRE
ncbi:unnamed protein product [Prorocentrum cordatum]|uniref:Uncharacterized protein n=1 Tax=Prorocentrum cordatum TaxID=2364126 RepID=A0ABN9S7E3_9DINO|nr:unnamed protein product [Polarella glacialis]